MTKFFSKTTAGFYSAEMRSDYEVAGSWPADAIAITDSEHAALLAGQATGQLIVANAVGVPILQAALLPTHTALGTMTLATARAMRQPIMSILDGMQASALSKGDALTATTIETAKQALKDITKTDLSACVTADEMKAVILTRYRVIAASLPTSIRSAFSGAIA